MTSGSSERDANTIPGTRISPTGSIRHRKGVSSTRFIAAPGSATTTVHTFSLLPDFTTAQQRAE
jgi:hypothetical protein